MLFGPTTPGETRTSKIFLLVVAGLCLLGLLSVSLHRHHYTGTIVAVRRVASGRFKTAHENRVTVRIGAQTVRFDDRANLLIGKLAPLDPKAKPQVRYRITTSGLTDGGPWFGENVIKLTRVK